MSLDKTITAFNNFYNKDINVSANDYELVFSFFRARTTSDASAKTFTNIIFRISAETKVNVLELLSEFESLDKMKITLTMAYYLNTFSETKTVLYGVNNILSPNEKIQRNIIHDNPAIG
jgi:hypothetical protein